MGNKQTEDRANGRVDHLKIARPAVITERRKKPRINDPVSIIVSGSDARGKTYMFDTIARNVGSGGICASAPRIMVAGEKILLHVQFAIAGSHPPKAPVIAARAVVLRAEIQQDESYLFAASFLLHRFL
jgi:hypothetical protein